MSNREENRKFKEAVRRIEREIGRKLLRKEVRRLKDEITHGGYDIEQIVEIGKAMFW